MISRLQKKLIKKTKVQKYLRSSLELIDKIETKSNYFCESGLPPISFVCELSKKTNEFAFSSSIPVDRTNNRFELKNVVLKNDNLNLQVDKIVLTKRESFHSIDQEGTSLDQVTGHINFLYDSKKENVELFRRVIIPINDVRFSNYISATSYKSDDNRFHNRSFIEIKMDNFTFHFYLYTGIQKSFLFIDSLSAISHNTFYSHIYPIILAYGFLTGSLPYGEAFFITCKNKNFKSIESFSFQTLQSSIPQFLSLINANSYAFESKIGSEKADFFRNKLKELDERTFSKICNKIYENEALLRSIILLLMANTYEVFAASAAYNVVLETLSKFFAEIQSEKIKPIQDKKLWKLLSKKFNEALETLKDEIGKETYNYFKEKKIPNLNAPTNRDMLSIQFRINGIDLTEEEEKIINLRNTFLHGGHPVTALEKQYETDNFGLLFYIQLRLHSMLNKLLLKYFGFDGYMINYVKLYENITKIKVDEEPFIKI